MIERIAVLGGSSVYTPELILSLISHNVNVRELVLLGRSERKLKLVSGFCQRLFDKSGFPTQVTGTSDPREAVAGAKYLLNNIRVGGMSARVRDEKLPPKLGLIGDETLGAGGFANALRTLPVVLELARVVEEVNPDATLINLTNPMGLCVEAIAKHTALNVVGVSDQPTTYVKKVAELLHEDPKTLDVRYLGLNHMGWIQDVQHGGRSVMGRVLDKLDSNPEDGFDMALVDLFRMIPTRRVALYFHRDEVLKKQQATARYRAEVLHEAEQQILKLYEDEKLTEVPDLTRARNALWYEETIVPLISALESDKPRKVILCVENQGAIRDLPDTSSVEVMTEVSKDGLVRPKVGNCPRFLKGLFLSVKESDRLTVEAVLHRSYEYALQALTINPFVSSLDRAKAFLDRIIKDEKLELH
jgi:6-phospho-beta-glucosidase